MTQLAIGAAKRRITWRHLARIALCMAVAGPVMYLLVQELAQLDRLLVAEALRQIPAPALLTSAALTAVSLFAVARYDLLALGQIGAPVPDKTAIRGGFAAVGLGQTLGFGLLVGAVVRWRLYRGHGVSLPQAGLVTAIVAVGFMLGLSIVLAGLAVIAPKGLALLTGVAPADIRLVALVVCAGLFVFLALCLAQPRLTVRGRRLSLPPIRLLAQQTFLAAADVIPAALALYVLIPGDAGLAMATVIPVYLAALGVGLVSATPGGLGALELACLTALPVVPPETMVAALIAHRAIYYGLPALLAAAILTARELNSDASGTAARAAPILRREPRAPVGHVPKALAPLLARSTRADAALALLGETDFVMDLRGEAALATARSGNCLIALSDPMGGHHRWPASAEAFQKAAARSGLVPVHYKVTPDFARLLTARGMVAVQCGVEAVLKPGDFSMTGSSRRELRRKVRSAEKAGTEIASHLPGTLPMTSLLDVARNWSDGRGGARGFSMGHCTPDYLKRFEILTARVDGRIAGFVTLWRSGTGTEAGIDITRLRDDAPAGTLHALVVEAIAIAAQDIRCTRFSLAGVPLGGIVEPANLLERLLARCYDTAPKCAANRGLMRFKSSFRPNYEPRYVVAKSQAEAALGLAEAARLIHRKG